MKKKWLWSASALILLLSVASIIYFKQKKEIVSYPVLKQIRYSFTIQNTTNQLIHNAGLTIYAPVKQTATQLCTNIEASHPHELKSDPLGNQILDFAFETLPPYATRIVRVKADLLLSEKPNRLAGKKKDLAAFLKPEKYVESDQQIIIRQAQSLKGSKALQTAENIFNWVAAHIKGAGYSRNERGALYALTRKTGDCTEHMDLFTALCRAAEIPCRRIGGYVCVNNSVLSAADFHNWAEFYYDGRWLLADPQNRIFMKNIDHYIATRIISDTCENDMQGYNRFHVRGEGVTVRMDS